MDIKREDLGLSFIVPDRPTVRDLLKYDSAIADYQGATMFERLWEGAKVIVKDWQCEDCPLDIDIDSADNIQVAEIIKTTGLIVFGHLQAARSVPKN